MSTCRDHFEHREKNELLWTKFPSHYDYVVWSTSLRITSRFIMAMSENVLVWYGHIFPSWSRVPKFTIDAEVFESCVPIDGKSLTLGACARVTVVVLWVCVCVCYRASCYIPRLYVESWVPLGFLCCSQRMYCVDFLKALFRSSGEIYWSPLPSLLLDEVSMDKRDSDGLFSWRLAYRTNDGSYNSTDSSLVTVDYQESLLACFLCKI